MSSYILLDFSCICNFIFNYMVNKHYITMNVGIYDLSTIESWVRCSNENHFDFKLKYCII